MKIKSGKSKTIYKWILLVLAFVLFFIMDNMVYNVRIINRGVAVGLGIDMSGEYIDLTAQVVLPKNGGVSSGGNNYINYRQKGMDIEQAVDNISTISGTELSIGQVIVIVLGREVVEKGKYEILEFLLANDIVADNVLLVMAEDKANDIMTAKIPVGEVASYQLFRLMHPVKQPLGMPVVNIKDFVVNTYSDAEKVNYLPIVSKEETDPSTDQGKENIEKADILRVERTAIMDKTGLKGELNVEDTYGLTLAEYDLQDGVLAFDKGNGEEISVQIVDSKVGRKYDYDHSTLELNLRLKTSRVSGRIGEDGMYYNNMDELELKMFKKNIEKKIVSVFEYGNSIGVDILSIKEGFYRRYFDKKAEIEQKDYLSSVKLKVNVNIIQR